VNPFIAILRDAVGALAWLGYAFLLAGVVVYGGIWVFRKWTTVYIRWQKNHHSDEWWGGWIPPATEAKWIAAGFIVLAFMSWAVSALIWMLR
jgi:hypothetical protein